jgi:hypothetical protein
MFLHASRLCLAHPDDAARELVLEARLPDELTRFLDSMRRACGRDGAAAA